MTAIPTRNEAKVRRLAVKRQLRAHGYSKRFVEGLYRRMVHHDDLRRGRALVDALLAPWR